MALSIFRRFTRRASRLLRHHWQGIAVSFNGNSIERSTNFSLGIEHPILLIQGFGSTRKSMQVLEKRLRSDGFTVFSVKLGGLFGTLNTRKIEKIALRIEEKVISLRNRYHLGKVTIIGHSKGGIIGRYLISCLNGAEYCRCLITLGTAHQGLEPEKMPGFAKLGIAMPSVRQMRKQSKFLHMLSSQSINENIKCVSIYSDSDRIAPAQICGWSTVRGNQPINVQLNGMSHTDYLLKQRVYEVIRQHLSA